MRVVLVGELNPYGSDPRLALFPSPSNSAGARLRKILGLPVRTYLALNRYNLCTSSWTAWQARESWERLLRAEEQLQTDEDTVIVLLGKKVQRAALADGPSLVLDPHRVTRSNGRIIHLLRLPHPSGRCMDWNDPTAAQRARAILAELAPGIPWGKEVSDGV